MQKKIIGVAIMAAIAVTAGWSISQKTSGTSLSDIALANVEALAACEPYYGGSCWQTVNYECCMGGGYGCSPCD